MKNNNPDKRSKKSLFDYYSKLARTILNSLSANISILDENGVILETNEAWKNFAMKNKMNRYFCQKTMFYLIVDPARQTLKWVRAGHEPAILYDQETDDFSELQGSGIALGVDMHFQYEKNQKENFSEGNIVLLATDGVWEARNKRGQMFGRTAVYDIIRNDSAAGANEIMEAIINQIKKFLGVSKPEDDLTLVVVKAL